MPARGGADLPVAAARLRQQVEVPVVRQDQMSFVAHDQSIADLDAASRQLVDFGEEGLRVHHDAVTDDARDARMQDAGWDEPEHELRPVHVHGMPGVVPTLIPRDDVEVRRQQVDDLAFAFVAPLSAQYS